MQGTGNPYMMQMCIVKDRNITMQLLKRAESGSEGDMYSTYTDILAAAGYRALFLSVDVPVLGRRLGEMRSSFTLPKGMSFPNLLSEGQDEFGAPDGKNNGPQAFDDTLEWEEIIPWLKANTKMQIWLKGISSPEDVEQAITAGVDGVVISNHGGRQLDGVPASLDSLRQCAPIAKGHIHIAVDGGIRRGSDIFKAIALGADFCFLGRVAIWGLAVSIKVLQNLMVADLPSTRAKRVLSLLSRSCLRSSSRPWHWLAANRWRRLLAII
jgi:(S)-2-hydroxy-acid oxidase